MLRIAGRMDRIDKVGKATFEVIDYKTGGYWRDGWKGVFDGGRRLQHALYGLAAVELLKAQFKNPKVEAGVYYFSTHKGRQERHAIKAPPLENVAQVMRDLRSRSPKASSARVRRTRTANTVLFAVVAGLIPKGN